MLETSLRGIVRESPPTRPLRMLLLLLLTLPACNDATTLGVTDLLIQSSFIGEGVLRVAEGSQASLFVTAPGAERTFDRSRVSFEVSPASLGRVSGFVFMADNAGHGRITARYDEVVATVDVEVSLAPERLEMVSEVPTESVVGSELSGVQMRVLAREDRPVQGVPVRFTASTGGGEVTPTSGTTDESGVVTATLTLGTEVGVNQFLATVEGLEPLELRVTGRPEVTSATIATVEGDGAVLAAGSPAQLRIRLLDAFGNPVPGVAVEWWFEDGKALPGGPRPVAVLDGRTDAGGVSSARWELPTVAGVYSAEATAAVEGQPTATFMVEVVAGDFVFVDVSPQIYAFDIGENLTFFAEPQDRYGNFVADAGPIEWTSADESILTVDSDGVVTGVSPGQTELNATIGGLTGSSTVSVASGPPVSIEVLDGAAQTAFAGTPFPTPVRVRVLDENGFGTPGEIVGFNDTGFGGGEFSPSVATTDGAGIAESVWIAGSGPGVHTARAAIDTDLYVLFDATVRAGAPAAIALQPSPAELRVGDPPLALDAVLQDEFGNEVGEAPLSWYSTNRAVATVDNAGVVTARFPGMTTIRASTYSGGVSGSTRVRVRPAAGGNQPPVADVGGPYRAIDPGGQIAFDGRASADADGHVVSWEWDFGDGGTGSGQTVSHTYQQEGRYVVTLTVKDDDGAAGTAQTTITVGEAADPAEIVLDPTAVSLTPGTSRQVVATVLDDGGEVLAGIPVLWESSAPTIAGVTDTGVVRCLNPGTATVRARVDGGPSATAVVSCAFIPLRGGLNEPDGLAPIVIRPFNSIATDANPSRGTGSFPAKEGGSEGWDDVERQYDNITLDTDTDAPLSSSGIVSMEYVEGPVPPSSSYTPGVMRTQPFTGPAHGSLSLKRIYVHTAFRLSGNFQNHPEGTKLFSLRSTGPSPFDPVLGLGGSPPYDLTVEFRGAADAGLGTITMASGAIQRDRWYELECEALIDSAVGAGDGVFRCWLNRTRVFDKTDVNYGTASGTDYVWSTVQVNPVWGGTGGFKNDTFHLFWDHFYVSGAAESGSTPPTVAEVRATPSSYYFTGVGQTAQLSAAAYDASGARVPDVTFEWSSSDPSVASVNDMGRVTARGLGRATITVAAVCCMASDAVPITVETGGDVEPLITEDFTAYNSVSDWVNDVRGIGAFALNRATVALDQSVKESGFSQSFRVTYPSKADADYFQFHHEINPRPGWTIGEVVEFSSGGRGTVLFQRTGGGSAKVGFTLDSGPIPDVGETARGLSSGEVRTIRYADVAAARCLDHSETAGFRLPSAQRELWVEWRWRVDPDFETVMPRTGEFTVRDATGSFRDEEILSSNRDPNVAVRVKRVLTSDTYEYEFARTGAGSHPRLEVGDVLTGQTSGQRATVAGESREDWACTSNPDWKFFFIDANRGDDGQGRWEYNTSWVGHVHWINGPKYYLNNEDYWSGGPESASRFWDGNWHTFRLHVKYGSTEEANDAQLEFWADGRLVKSLTGFSTGGSTRFEGISWAHNLNQGPAQDQRLWMQWIKVWNRNPGWD